jgi:hypothetical protein
MRVAVWVGNRPDDVRALLHTRAARSRRLVPSQNGTFVLGPAPEDAQVLLDGLRVATTGGRPAVGVAWTDSTAWLVVATEHGTTGVRFGPEALPRPEVADADFPVPDYVSWRIAAALGVRPDEVDEAFHTTSGHGLPRLLEFLDVTGFGSEAQVLAWIEHAGTDLVPVHGRRWPDLLLGELRQPRNTRSQSHHPDRSVVLTFLIGVYMATFFAGSVAAALFAHLVVPWPWDLAVRCVAGVCAIGCAHGIAQLVLMTRRWRRADPFPFSDPLGVLSTH